jgi:hypothetical protein
MDSTIVGSLVGVGALVIGAALRNEHLIGKIQGLIEGITVRITRIERNEDVRDARNEQRLEKER